MAPNPPKDVDDLMRDDEEALLKDLNLDDVDVSSDAQASGGRALPKKVELDIDDLGLDEEEPAAPEKPEPEPLPAPPPLKDEVARPKPRLSRTKLILFIAAAVLPLLIGGGVAAWYFLREKEPPPQVEVGPGQLELLPFIVNFPGSNPERLLELKLAVVFKNQQDQAAFESESNKLRDLIYRFVQGKKPDDLEDSPETKKELSLELAQLINASLKNVTVDRVVVVEIKKV
ncbi:MAG: flagellar basal body-associated FliL family protein [Pseudomonadota bacterium]